MSRKPWFYKKQYHCKECAATDSNYSFAIFAPPKKLPIVELNSEAIAHTIVDAVNSYDVRAKR